MRPATALRLRQVGAVALLELRRSFFRRAALGTVLLAATPLLLFGLVRVVRNEPLPQGRAEREFAEIFQYLVLQVTLFFGCAKTFGDLVRGEVLKRSLHHLFLAPVRREVLVAGKYLAALAGSTALFGGGAAATYLLLFSGGGTGTLREHLTSGGAERLFAYLVVVFLACASYGAAFLVFGQVARSPIVPALALWGWEHLNFLLPAALKRLGLIHYLVSVCPVAVPDAFLSVVAEPLPVWVAVPAPLALATALVAAGALLATRMEIDYGVE